MNILFILPSLNLYGGTPKKTLELIQILKVNAVVYTYDDEFKKFTKKFEQAGATVISTNYKRNIFKHYKALQKIILGGEIQIVQTQFTFGEFLGLLCKLINRDIKILNAFVGITNPSFFKKLLLNQVYNFVDCFIYVSNYVKKEKEKQFPILRDKMSKVIYNGSKKRNSTMKQVFDESKFNLLTIGGLIDVKNIDLLIETMKLLKNDNQIHLTILGDGPNKNKIMSKINKYELDTSISVLGYVDNVGDFLSNCDIYLHPAYAEGFGIAVVEAMFAKKPIIVSNMGALTEIIKHNVNGQIIDFDKPADWVKAIIHMYHEKHFRNKISTNALNDAKNKFSLEIFSKNYQNTYTELT